jgi:hypothetical protein
MDEEIDPPIENNYVMTPEVIDGMMNFVAEAPTFVNEGTGNNVSAEYLGKLESDVKSLLWLAQQPRNP